MPPSDIGFAEFVAARGPALARSAYVLTGDAHLAEDLLQSALAKAAPRWARLDQPEAYVRRAMYTEHVSWWRRRRHVREVPLVADAGRHVDPPDDATAHTLALREVLAKLTPKQRAVLVLRYYEDLSEAQTAAVLEVSVGTVKSQTHEALKRVRALAPHLADASF